MLTLLALFACSTPEAPVAPAEPALIRVRLALNWYPEPEFGGFYEGVLGGIYKEAGFDVELIPGGPGAPTLSLLGTGAAEAAITAADDLLLARNRGIKAIGVWPAFQVSPIGLMVHPETGVTGFHGIKSGRVAMEIGGPFQLFLAHAYNLDKQVELVPTTGAVASWLADPTLIQQGYITAEPCALQIKGEAVRFLRAADAGWNPYGTLVALPEPLPGWASAFVHATATAWSAYAADPTRANAEIGRLNDQMDAELLPCIAAAQAPYLSGDDGMGAMTKARWDALNEGLIAIGLLDAGATADSAWANVP